MRDTRHCIIRYAWRLTSAMWSQAQILGFDTAVLRTTSNFSSFTSRLRRTFTLLYSTFTLLSINIVGLSVKRIRQTKAPGYPLRLYAVQRHETSQRIAEETESIVEVIILSNLQLLWNCQATIPHPPALPGIGAAQPGPGPDERYWQTHSNPAST